MNLNFVGSHPMAGSERSGYSNSTSELFDNRLCIVCENNEKIINFWKYLDMRIVISSPEKHDKLIAVTSHFIHFLSFSYIYYIKKYNIDIKDFIGPSFQEFTRIASSNPEIWADIFIDNKNKIDTVYKEFKKALKEFNEILKDKERLKDFLAEIKDYKEKL